ncbi:hypothetical protein B0I03_10547 [Flavobacterium aquaticum]|uniref:Uncharacterized protein n=1 Tax=Flavobacterium aquaticum TaxID=1236486 RepID=A0A327YPM8_9FLAO|nr:hypothetical protein [Flavobacterium aquaticum]RAK21615.1 hypothetical protein B0I03_10547 [Flavobacterium aquaticum]
MYEFLKNLAEDNDWVFEYSRSDYQNLYDEMTNDKIHLFVDPITTSSSFSDSGFEEKSSYGKLMILVSSDVDEDYKQKYDNHIKPIIDGALQVLKDTLVCADANIQKFETIEVINLFDFNLDGVLVNYNVILND